ncbi:DinB family protein [Pseudonocardia petroleophila]|uniref:DinB family protein n=1 Tax=Pseudonocardia petroleophila TaxID=37331 RepID=A0A7G7MNZ2_9PSEU|nr:DinB family protein [Pseudonocardia petroleophila]QNG54503.1 DinB family protein [Pseudonocardia petroleophila]
MTETSLKADLHDYLRAARSAAVWKLDGLSDYDVRRPLVATGTNLLGIVKHLATVEWGHFGAAFGEPDPASLPWSAADAEPDADMWAAEHETRAELLDLYTQVCAASDAVIAGNDLDAIGHVPWWPEPMATVTLQHILIHTIAEANRHAGHSDIVRELIDGSAGYSAQVDLVSRDGQAERREQWERLEGIARRA